GPKVAPHRVDRDGRVISVISVHARKATNRTPSGDRFARKEKSRSGLDIDHLPAAVHPVVRVDAMRAESAAVHRILCELRRLEAFGGATLGAAGFRLFAFRIGHGLYLFGSFTLPILCCRITGIRKKS